MMSAIVSVSLQGETYLLLHEEARHSYTILGYPSVQEALKRLEVVYDEAHTRGYERSMSACLNYISLSPRVHEAPPEADLPRLVGVDPRVVHASGLGFVGVPVLPLEGEGVQEFREAGIAPRLITVG